MEDPQYLTWETMPPLDPEKTDNTLWALVKDANSECDCAQALFQGHGHLLREMTSPKMTILK